MDLVENMAEFQTLQDLIWKLGDNKYSIEKLLEEGYEVKKKDAEFEKMTPDEIREEIRKEFEAKEKGIKWFEEMKANGQVTKVLEEKGLNAEFLSMIESKKATGNVLEFGAQEFNFEIIEEVIKALPKHNTESVLKKTEFSKDEKKEGALRGLDLVALMNKQRGGK